MRKKVGLALVFIPMLLILMATLVVAEGQQEEAGGAMEGVLQVWHPYTQQTRLDAIEAISNDFSKEYPEISVEIEVVPFPKIPEKWATAVAADTTPDVFGNTAWNAIDAYKAGKLVPADTILKELGGWDAFNGAETIKKALVYEGKLLALPLYGNTRVLVYRRDILNDEGLTPPVTWEEYVDTASKLTNAPDRYGFFQMWDPSDVGATMYHQIFQSSNDGSFFDNNGNPILTSKENIETIEFMMELYEAGSPQKEFSFTYRDVFNLFASGKAPMVLNSGFMMNAFENNMPELAEKRALAIGEPPYKVQPAGNATYTPISLIKGDMEEAGKEYIKYLFDEKNYTRWVHALPGAMLPVLKATVESEEYWDNPQIQKYEDGIKQIIDALNNDGLWPGEINENLSVVTDYGIIENMYQKIALGRADVQQAAEEAQAEMEKRIKERER